MVSSDFICPSTTLDTVPGGLDLRGSVRAWDLNHRTESEQRLVVSDYFLNEYSFGKVHSEGDHKVHVAKVERNNLELDPRFQLDFNTAFPTCPARPHGVVFK